MKFSIIIPVKRFNPFLDKCLKECKKQKDSEVIVVSDEPFKYKGVKVLLLKGPPGDKRDFAAKKAKGEFLAFIDDDAYPEKNWLANSLKHFQKNVAAVAGPAVTPENEEFKRKASGLVFSSPIGGGGFGYRYSPDLVKEVDDYPTVNFIVRKKDFEKAGGFNTKYWPGEDTILCLKLKKLGKIIYAGNVVVFHHRRKLFKEHLKQVSSYALHRGFFAKKFPENSLKIIYFLPSFFVIGLAALLISSIFSPTALTLLILVILAYALIVAVESLRISIIEKNSKFFFFLFPSIILTHLFYGVNFIKGLASKDLTN